MIFRQCSSVNCNNHREQKKTTNKKKQSNVWRFSQTHTRTTHARIPNRTSNAPVFKIELALFSPPTEMKAQHTHTQIHMHTHFTTCPPIFSMLSLIHHQKCPSISSNSPSLSRLHHPFCKVCACLDVIFLRHFM